MLTKSDLYDILVKHFALHQERQIQMYEKNFNIGYLLDFYGDILSERKRSVLDMYYNEDFSLAEISQEIGISRQGVRDIIKKTEDELLFFEEKLGLSSKLSQLDESAENLLKLARELDAPKPVLDSISELKQQIAL